MSKATDLVGVSQGASGDPLFIDTTNDRVGVGTASPGSRVEIFSPSSALTTGNLALNTSSTTGASRISFKESGSTVGQIAYSHDNNNLELIANESGSGIVLYTNGTTERARINSSGKLGVGTTAPNGRVTVAAMDTIVPTSNLNNFAMTVFGGYGGGISLIDSVDPNSGTGYAIWVEDFGNDLNIARGTTSSGAAGGVYINNSAGSWSSRSDERDKVNLEPITDAASKVQSLRAVTGEYIWDAGVRHPFLIAQDVQAVFPEAVSIANKTAPEEEQRFGLSYTDMVPLLVAAIKELKAEVDSLKTRLTALEVQ